MSRQTQRINKIKRKYGQAAFSKWGKQGGSPILKAWAKGRIPRSVITKSKD